MGCGERWARKDLIEKLVNHLSTNLMFRPYLKKECSSTQDIAKDLAMKGAFEGTLVICERMSKGRGRHGRSWIADYGGLWFTLILRPSRNDRLQLLSLLSGLSVAEALEDTLGVEAKIKWPNDILVKGKKVAGVLIEATVSSEGPIYVLLGVGINTNNCLPEELRSYATSLTEVMGEHVNNYFLLKSLLKRIDINYGLYLSREDKQLLNAWSVRDLLKGKSVTIYLHNGFVRGVAAGINDDGSYKLRVRNEVIKVTSGEVIHVR